MEMLEGNKKGRRDFKYKKGKIKWYKEEQTRGLM